MILYFDTFITNIPRSDNRKLLKLINNVRLSETSFKERSKYDIFKYTLSSYSILQWDKVIVNISGENSKSILEIINYSKNLFTNLIINNTRCDTGNKYCDVIDNYSENNSWIFFAPHNDHVFISQDLDLINRLKNLAEKYELFYNLPVVILYSHFTESLNNLKKDNYLYKFANENFKIIDECDDAYVLLRYEIPLLSTHIIRSKVLRKLMSIAKDREVITTESLGNYLNYNESCIQIIPKSEISRHYDGYMHTFSVVNDYVSADKVPPLFIPDGFFTNSIIINYGFNEYIKGTVNVNPYKKSYIFTNKEGTDIGDIIKNIPLFWKDKISKINIKEGFAEPRFVDIYLANKIINPWNNKPLVLIKVIHLFRYLKFYLKKSFFGITTTKLKKFIIKTKFYLFFKFIYRSLF
jgi:hypothetical protein